MNCTIRHCDETYKIYRTYKIYKYMEYIFETYEINMKLINIQNNRIYQMNKLTLLYPALYYYKEQIRYKKQQKKMKGEKYAQEKRDSKLQNTLIHYTNTP